MAAFSMISTLFHVYLPSKFAFPIRCSSASPPLSISTQSRSNNFDLKTYWTTLITQMYQSMRYSMLADGAKRASPVMCVTACELFGGNRLAAFPTACALEMVHAASLMHDDLPCMDDDPSRRRQPSNYTIYGDNMALFTGDSLFPLGFQHIVSNTPSDLVPEPRLLRVITEIAQTVGSTRMAAGQFLDLEGGPNAVELAQEKKFSEMSQFSAKGFSYVKMYGLEKSMEVVEQLRAKAKQELDGFEKYGDGVVPLYSFVDYAIDRGFSVS
ncbi:heterodimeric geranylgeranyl pyrophosphate synthase small subunit [Pyrus ussuriensis x Pyrus communis]|uniref:Heterodimeric geranylgeranyl pyrophosphate synthase small subunit n=1 Tax=Pyrus ussuriensis x Pyrus communis TaxID=2448454 RepID=A0A5N5FIC1_9ROSA|nr:heterodimeric geranylgeranyl pyrophosphate synthase small subunit [Pyrus ussuriensis x Pyrus communis]